MALQRSNRCVVSIMSGWNPRHYECFPDIVDACAEGGSSLFGTGLNPGLSKAVMNALNRRLGTLLAADQSSSG